MELVLRLCVLLLLWSEVTPARILAIFPGPTYSHYASGSRIMKELARRGHQVTVISAFPQKNKLENFRDVELTGTIEDFEIKRKTMNMFELGDGNPIVEDLFVNQILLNATDTVLGHTAVQQLLKSNEKFDVVIVEEFFCYSLKGLCFHYNAHCITYSSIGTSRFLNAEIGNPTPLSYINDTFLPFIERMNFFQRLYNAFVYLVTTLYKNLYILSQHNLILHKYFPDAPDIHDLIYNVSLTLVNAHVSTHQPVPYVPVVIDVGGVHVDPPKKLPKDLQEYLDNAKDGAIFFSMGSNLRSTQMSVEKRDIFIRAFSKLKQKVLWKWEDDNLPNKPDNVMIRKWLPQNDILAHPNVKLFISHGGLLSTIEAVYNGIPIIGLPVYGDQAMNIATAVHNGIALSVPYTKLTEENFGFALEQILTNATYAENAKKRSNIMHDQPLNPLDKAIFWIEYVIKHNGAHHLRVGGLHLAWYQYLLLDVVVFVLAVTIVTALIVRLIMRKICSQLCKQSGKSKKKTKLN